ncbi:phage terminase small subunit P27 family [Demequina capsici]|uniref:Phage terminase small subunit P27 family n=1 Tax=Demequina capsici TaxID=3075620 RepID=A0AA96FDF9_9MICO|nr:phage terminase small subunit P27 family [Demequina sp. PMTSA13]WNM27542.1 phage terminase small subunit P27 family [Demequina sp. PMTSA13]
MAGTANLGRKAMPRGLRVLNGSLDADGNERDSSGHAIEPEIQFERGDPVKPEGMSPDAEWLWDQVIEQMQGVGVLKPLDGPALEVACETFARWREAKRMRQEQGTLATNSQGQVTAPWVGIEERASKEIRAWFAEFGITPAAERNLRADSGGGDDDSNPF